MRPKTKKKIRIFSKFICFIAFVALVLFLYYLKKLNVLPNKYFYLIAACLSFLELIFILFSLNRKIKAGILIFMDIIAILIIAVEAYGAYKLAELYGFLDEDIKVTETKEIYYLMVNKDSKYNDLKSIEGKFVDYFNDADDFEKLKSNVLAKANVILNETTDYSSLLTTLEKDKEKIVLTSDANYDFYLSSLEEDKEQTSTDETENKQTQEEIINAEKKEHFKILAEIELVNVLEENTSDEDLMNKPFIIYLSGIDTRSNKLPSRSRSDVNIFIVVNPKSRDVLLVNTPRDYYVQLHGKSGLKDKLTHAGYVGGVQLSKATLEDLLGYKADHYVRVNFNSVIKLVDAIGGITVNSDVNYNIKCWANTDCIIKPGKNNVDGTCALAFARERHAYRGGDRHRGQNQQQVIQRVIEKVSSSKNLIMNYDKILKAMNKTFESSLSTKNITSVVQFQLNDMRGWNITTANLDGPTGMTATYTCPNCKRSVMYQSQKSIDAAKAKIKEVLEK